jgi:hypothetical protein
MGEDAEQPVEAVQTVDRLSAAGVLRLQRAELGGHLGRYGSTAQAAGGAGAARPRRDVVGSGVLDAGGLMALEVDVVGAGRLQRRAERDAAEHRRILIEADVLEPEVGELRLAKGPLDADVPQHRHGSPGDGTGQSGGSAGR